MIIKILLKELIEKEKLTGECKSEFNVFISTTTVEKYIEQFCFSLKRVYLIPVRRNDQRSIWEKIYALKYLDLAFEYEENEFIFIDAVGFNVSMRSSCGRSLIGIPAT